MKILHVIASVDPRHGGVSEGVKQLAQVSIELGCELEIVTLDEPEHDFLSTFPCKVHATGPGFTHFRYSAKLSRWLDQHAADFDVIVVHALWQYHSIAARKAALNHGVPYVVYTHGMLDPYFKQAHPIKHARKWLFWPWADYRVLRDANEVLFTTDEERRLARQSFWLYKAKEAVVNLGVRRPSGHSKSQVAAFYRRFPELEGLKQALFLGRIHPKKGCDLVLDSFAKVLAADPFWQLVMAGPDQVNWRPQLQQRAEALGIAERITWTGMLTGDEKWGALHAAEFFFLPSHQENFGVAVAEALACGLPVLISDKVNIWREVEECSAGLIGPDTLTGAIQLLSNWLKLGSHGQQEMRRRTIPCFEEKFEVHTATRNLIASLTPLLKERPKTNRWVQV